MVPSPHSQWVLGLTYGKRDQQGRRPLGQRTSFVPLRAKQTCQLKGERSTWMLTELGWTLHRLSSSGYYCESTCGLRSTAPTCTLGPGKPSGASHALSAAAQNERPRMLVPAWVSRTLGWTGAQGVTGHHVLATLLATAHPIASTVPSSELMKWLLEKSDQTLACPIPSLSS